MFIGREEELKKIDRFVNDEFSKACLIYGRRRVGKSELITESLRKANVKFLYYECKQTTEENNVDSFIDILLEIFNLPSYKFTDFESALKYAFSLSINDTFVIVLDEYPYLRECVHGIDSIIQNIIDQNKKNNIKIVLLGSYIDAMKSLVEHDNPLYGRFDLKIELRPMDYYDSSKFYPNYSNEDKVKIYSVFGGIPYYNRLINQNLSVKENIIELIASDGARLENEINGFLKAQLTKINNANEIIEILSEGAYKYKDIYAKANIQKGPTLIDALDKLVMMELVGKVSPINDENNKKKTGYIILDPLSNFYYRYIYRNRSRLKIMNSIDFYDRYISSDYEEQYVPKFFEKVCKEYLIRINKSGKIDVSFDQIGKYYYDDKINHCNGEFDIVTHDSNGYIFYESKFHNKPLSKHDIEKEIEQVNKSGLKSYRYGFISKSGYSFTDENLILLSLNDLYNII